MAPLRWAIAGAGEMSHDFANAVQIFPEEHTVVAVASASKERAEKFALENNIPKAYEGYEAIANDAEVQVVYIGNLVTQHYSTTKLMLEHGKAVLCETPFTINEKQTTYLVNLARSKKLFLMLGVWCRCFPAYSKVRELLDNASIGDIQFVYANTGIDSKYLNRLAKKELGGGAILDLSIYCFQFLQFVFPELQPTKIVVNGSLNKYDVDGTSGALLSYPGGKLASVACSSDVMLSNEAIIHGTEGTIKIPQFWCPTEVITEQQTYKFDLPQHSESLNFTFPNTEGLYYEAHEVKHCLEEGKLESSKITHQETIQLAKLLDTMRKEVGYQFPEDLKSFK
ncbi:hypothetical protein HHI36_018762 [Cryptolaemus montrouzieri]|uniref:Trans-1,2-dihydrobenzene-1,2-diol dehydrogenase n=1 Tax=Cryptolaemus montrouzieri TaxID=559131 RepID=A0ABD2P0Y1_9CUCU